ncbi:MAG: hypothetical protein AAFW60_06160, partial [Pseudomonadota bacterium]
SDEVSGDNRPSLVTTGQDLSEGRGVEDLHLDTTFSIGPEPIRMEWSTHAITLTSDLVFAHATVYVPPDEAYFCVEPITHAPNAVNSALPADQTGFRTLAPGETLWGSIQLIIEH